MERQSAEQHHSASKTFKYDDMKSEAQETKMHDVGVGDVLSGHTTPEQEKRVVLKLDVIMIPLMGICYMMQFMDKLALSQATMFDLREDLNLQGQEYSWASAIFYFGYLAWSPISSYLAVRLPLGKYLTVMVFIWGGVLMCHGAAKNFAGLMAARFFLGVGEAAIAPGFSLITGMFYKREEQPARQSAWFFGNCVASVIGGVVAWGIGTVDNDTVNSWQLLFLALGAITAGIGLFLAVLLPDTPKNAIFLSETERLIALQRTHENQPGGTDTGRFRWNQVWLCLRDPQTWFLVLYTFCVNLCNGGITSFSIILINSFGFTQLQSLLLQMPLGGAQIVFLLITAIIATFLPRTRIAMMILNTVTSLIGMILVWQLGMDDSTGRLVGLSLGAVFAVNIPLSLSVISSNVAGFTKRSVTSAMLFAAYCLGNIVGPQFFLAAEAPEYPTGIAMAVSGLALALFFLICLLVYYILENRRRDKVYGLPTPSGEAEESAQGLHKTDLEIKSFRYLL